MGYGQYSHSAHQALTNARKGRSQGEVFTQRKCHPSMDPMNLGKRESRDSETNPNSIGIIFALDVSGSMGEIPARLATHTLPQFMGAMEQAQVGDPQVMFMAVGYAGGDRAPLQVGQFESTAALMDQWLTSMYLEGGGGGGDESYELAMYVAARHTILDCVEKRGKRGYLFITGDEPPNAVVSRAHIQRTLGTPPAEDIRIQDMIEEVGRTYEVFYLIPDPQRGQRVGRQWRDLLGDRVVVMETPDDTSHVCAGLVSLLEGGAANLGELIGRLQAAGVSVERSQAVARALTPFAASISRDGAPRPNMTSPTLPTGNNKSGIDR